MTGRVHVVGSANVDRTIPVAAVPGPGETVLGGLASRGPGGKGLNQAVAAARLGAPTSFLGAIGDDPDGELLLDLLESEAIETAGLRRVDASTGLAVILLEPDGSNRIVVSPGANDHAVPDGLGCVEGDVVVAQLEIPTASVAAAVSAGRAAGALTVVNAAPARPDLGELLPPVDLLVVNQPELALLGGSDPVADPRDDDPPEPDLSALGEAARALPAGLGVVVTLGALGAVLVTEREERWVRAPSVDVVDTTGAGDCFVGALAAGLAAGHGLTAAAETAVRAAASSVTRSGAAASMPHPNQLRAVRPATTR